MKPSRRSLSAFAKPFAGALAAVFIIASCASSSPPKSAPQSQASPSQSKAETKTEAPQAEPEAETQEAQAVSPQPTLQEAAPTQQSTAGTVLKTADPSSLARGREEREAIETSIVFGSPSSLARARELASKATTLKAEEAQALDEIARRLSSLVYPEASSHDEVAKADRSAIDVASLPIGNAQRLLPLLDEVLAGRAPSPSLESTGDSLGELIPSLALFVSESNESSRLALDALDRFARLGVPSILPSLIRGADAEQRGDWQSALGLYRSALAIAPDAWRASLGSARALIALKRGSEALALLSPIAEAHSGLAAFDRPYALALYVNGRFSEADPFVARTLTRDPQDSRFLLLRAHLLVLSKSYQQVLPILDAYGTVDATNRLYLLLRGLDSEALRNRDEALKWARRGLAAYPDDCELLALASRLLFAGPAFGREEARTLAARSCELSAPGIASPAETELATGAVLLAQRNAAGAESARLLALDAAGRYQWSQAASYLARAGSAFSDKALAALILRKSGSTAASLDYASAWHKAEPRSEAAAEAYARALVDSGDEKLAQDTIARLLQGASAASYRSDLYMLQARLQKSEEASLALLRSALVEDADNSEALAAISDILVKRKDYSKARFYLKQAVAIDPDDPELEDRVKKLDALSAQ
jgi:Uncharacterized enzyme of heme biosynthesis